MTRMSAGAVAAWPAAALVGFHDAECHGYDADLPVWRDLAAACPGPVLDIGAGTGRVSLDLAARGHDVTALDVDPALLAALDARAAARDLGVRTVVADAEVLPSPAEIGIGAGMRTGSGSRAPFGLVLVPMQTVQLLDDRPALLARVRRLLAPGGRVALAIADTLLPFDATRDVLLPDPDVAATPDGWRYESQPLALHLSERRARIERLRTAIAPDGTRTTAEDVIELRRLDAPTLAAEGEAAGLTPVPGARIDATDEHVGSAVVLLRG